MECERIGAGDIFHVALGSLGESVSGLYAYWKSEQISEEDFQNLDILAFKLFHFRGTIN